MVANPSPWAVPSPTQTLTPARQIAHPGCHDHNPGGFAPGARVRTQPEVPRRVAAAPPGPAAGRAAPAGQAEAQAAGAAREAAGEGVRLAPGPAARAGGAGDGVGACHVCHLPGVGMRGSVFGVLLRLFRVAGQRSSGLASGCVCHTRHM